MGVTSVSTNIVHSFWGGNVVLKQIGLPAFREA